MIIACPNCGRSLPPEVVNAPDLRICPACNSNLLVRVFPAHSRVRHVIGAEAMALNDDDASCFFHASKRAVNACSQCGRFVCALCEVDLSGTVLCPGCLQTGGAKKKIKNLENRRTLWDTTSLLLGAAPILLPFPMIYLIFLTGPMAVFIPLKYWNAPSSLIPRNKWRFIAGGILGLLQIAALVGVVVLIVAAFQTARHR